MAFEMYDNSHFFFLIINIPALALEYQVSPI